MADNVNHPAHYETGKFECIDVMVETQGVEATQDFCVCNALKYVYRHKKKNGMEDLQKAIWYLNKAVELEEAKNDKLANMSSQAEIRSCLLKEFEDGRTEIRKGIKARKNEMIKGITDNYRNVIANVSNMKNAKLAMEYLKSLGFDLSDLVKADENPVTTALSVEVDTRFLFIGGKKNEVE